MKKTIALLLVLLAITSCTQDIKFNNPAVQGLKDGVLWRANDSFGTLNGTSALTLVAATQFETLTLKTTSATPGTYVLGTSDSKKATFNDKKDGGNVTYQTSINVGDGEIIITEFDQEARTVSGTFRFNAKNTVATPQGSTDLNFQEGVFYKVPIR
jgi:hypothetical protein